MTLETIIAIASLCGAPSRMTYHDYYASDVLACQKYYIKCVERKSLMAPLAIAIADCIVEKQYLGGDK